MQTQTNCFHCGDKVLLLSWQHNDKLFCCEGCKVVYQVIAANGLENYYKLEEKPGITPSQNTAYFDFLDDEKIQQTLLQYNNSRQAIMHFDVPHIHCSSCIWLLENISRLYHGILCSEVNFTDKKLTVKYDPGTSSLKKIAELMAKLGYSPAFNMEKTEKGKSSEDIALRKLLLRLGVAGFCFGNIMLLAFPEYLDLPHAAYEKEIAAHQA